jgi:hypothetical protein
MTREGWEDSLMGRGRLAAVAGCCVVAAALPYLAGVWTIPPAFVVLGIGVLLVARSDMRLGAKFLCSLAVVLASFARLVGFLFLVSWASND